MSDGLMLPPGQGRSLGAGITLKVGTEQAASASSFEIIVPPGYDVGAHVHARQEELFYILEGELDLFAFEPVTRTAENWRIWQSHTGAQVFRGGPGSLMFVPPGCPHAFAAPRTTPSRMFFQAAPAAHEGHLEEPLAPLQRGGPPYPEMMNFVSKRCRIA